MPTGDPVVSYLGNGWWSVGDTTGTWHTCYWVLTRQYGMCHSEANAVLASASRTRMSTSIIQEGR